MCRLFGFRSVVPSQVHRSLVNADNALAVQSGKHPDGWGVAYYIDDAPHVTRSPDAALHDQLFRKVSGVVSSQTVVAHVRSATAGGRTVLNCHPFQYGRWVFAHNGDIPELEGHRARLESEVAPGLRRFILGETDSELVFFMFLTRLSRLGPLSRRMAVEEVSSTLLETVMVVREIADGPLARSPSLLTLLVTDGQTMAAVEGGKELYWSSYKERCADRDNCPYFADVCEAPSPSGHVNHLIISSDPVIEDNVWHKLETGEVIGVDWRMRLHRAKAEHKPRQHHLRVL